MTTKLYIQRLVYIGQEKPLTRISLPEIWRINRNRLFNIQSKIFNHVEIAKIARHNFFGYKMHKKNSRLLEAFSKIRILVQDRGGAEFQNGGISLYVEDLKRGTNKDIGSKDIFRMASNKVSKP